jgi:hypothetical protein
MYSSDLSFVFVYIDQILLVNLELFKKHITKPISCFLTVFIYLEYLYRNATEDGHMIMSNWYYFCICEN